MKNDSVSLLKNKDVLIVPLNPNMNDQELKQFELRVLQETSKEDTIRSVVIDVSSFESMDLFAAKLLFGMVKKLEMMDIKSVMVGIRPEVAITLMDIGIEFPDVITAPSLERGLRLLKRSKK